MYNTVSSSLEIILNAERMISMHICKKDQVLFKHRVIEDRVCVSTYFPLTLHFGSLASTLAAISSGTPTTTSALLVRRLRIGIWPASGPIVVSKGVETGHLTSPVSLGSL